MCVCNKDMNHTDGIKQQVRQNTQNTLTLGCRVSFDLLTTASKTI